MILKGVSTPVLTFIRNVTVSGYIWNQLVFRPGAGFLNLHCRRRSVQKPIALE